MSTKRRRRHSPEQIVKKLRDADAICGRSNGQAHGRVLRSRTLGSQIDRALRYGLYRY